MALLTVFLVILRPSGKVIIAKTTPFYGNRTVYFTIIIKLSAWPSTLK
jgi:hypothetical protein